MPHVCLRKRYLFIASILFVLQGFAQNGQTPMTKEAAARWVKKGDWKQGLDKKVHPSVNAVLFAEQYNKNKAVWDKAFAFLGRGDLDTLSPGMYPIDGKLIYASIGEPLTKDFDKTKWESHRKYIDLQYMIRGEEQIGVAPVAGATVTEPYDDAKDIAHYETTGKFYVAKPGTFFLFFPVDAHRPDRKVKTNDHVKKLVIKIGYVE